MRFYFVIEPLYASVGDAYTLRVHVKTTSQEAKEKLSSKSVRIEWIEECNSKEKDNNEVVGRLVPLADATPQSHTVRCVEKTRVSTKLFADCGLACIAGEIDESHRMNAPAKV